MKYSHDVELVYIQFIEGAEIPPYASGLKNLEEFVHRADTYHWRWFHKRRFSVEVEEFMIPLFCWYLIPVVEYILTSLASDLLPLFFSVAGSQFSLLGSPSRLHPEVINPSPPSRGGGGG
jgi:hypothetical protein